MHGYDGISLKLLKSLNLKYYVESRHRAPKATKPNVVVQIGNIRRFEKPITENKFLDEAKYQQYW